MLKNSTEHGIVKICVASLAAFVAIGGMVFVGRALLIMPTTPLATPGRVSADGTMVVSVYFNNLIKNTNETDCTLVYPVSRTVPKTLAIGRAALEELLTGPTPQEKAAGYYTSIKPGVKINSLAIVDGVARVDFDATLDQGIGGSCLVTAIRSEITQTLMQFPTVKNVVISVAGNSEEALQP